MATSTIKNTKVKSSERGWGTSITFTLPDGTNQALVCVNATFFVIWLGGTVDINVRGIMSTNQIGFASASGQVTLDDNTFKRNNSTVTVSRSANATFRAFY